MKKGRLVTVLLVVIIAASVSALLLYRSIQQKRDGLSAFEPSISVQTTGEMLTIDLYFTDREGSRLALERREIPVGFIDALTRSAIESLLSGPEKENLTKTIPEGVQIRSMFVKDGTAYVDFTSSITANHVGGAWTELLTIYSIINTLTENFAEIGKVQLLIDGRESETLAGHVDISRPLPGRVQLLAGDW